MPSNHPHRRVRIAYQSERPAGPVCENSTIGGWLVVKITQMPHLGRVKGMRFVPTRLPGS